MTRIPNSIHEYCIRVVCCPHGEMNPHELRCKDSSCRVVSKVQPEGLADQCLFSRADLCSTNQQCYFPQIAIAIGVLTSNRGEGDEPLWRIGRGTRVPLQGAVDVVPLLGAIVGYHCSVPS